MNLRVLLTLPLLGLTMACTSDDGGGGGAAAADGGGGATGAVIDESDGCGRAKREDDLQVIPLKAIADATLPETGFVVATTFLRITHGDAGAAVFSELETPVQGELVAAPGVLAVELAVATSCNTARTLSVWESIEAMYGFVGGPAHATAMERVAEVSRGGSVTTHWDATAASEASWEEALRRLSSVSGPVY
ncbi:MAG: DUF3291 domain-containing protein [Deltaproteobacteria bacterium]|nr:DUF3291 domain-containing protein [Deltaproteobacteria bacterium]